MTRRKPEMEDERPWFCSSRSHYDRVGHFGLRLMPTYWQDWGHRSRNTSDPNPAKKIMGT